MASQNPDFEENCEQPYCGRRRVHLRQNPGRGEAQIGPKIAPNCLEKKDFEYFYYFGNPKLLLRGCWGYCPRNTRSSLKYPPTWAFGSVRARYVHGTAMKRNGSFKEVPRGPPGRPLGQCHGLSRRRLSHWNRSG